MNIRRSLGSLFVLISATALAAQDYSPAGMFGEQHGDFLARMDHYRPMVSLSASVLPNAELKGDPGNFDEYRLLGDGMVPIAVDPDSLLLFGGTIEARRYEFSSKFGGQNDWLSTLGLHIGYGHFFTDDLYVQAVFSPGIYSDLDGTLTRDDYQWFGTVLGTYRLQPDFFLKAGVEVAQTFDETPVYPIGGFSWLMTEQWRLDVLAPRRAELVFEPSSAASIYAGIELEGQEYRVRPDVPGPNGNGFDFRAQELRLYGGATYRLDDHFSIFGKVGSAVAGKYQIGSGSAKLDSQLDPTFFAEIGVGFDF